jgi:hypothetical protein
MVDLFGLSCLMGASASASSSGLGSALGAASSASLSGLDNLIGAAIGSESAASLAPSVAMGIDGTKSALVLGTGALVVGGSLWAGHAWGESSASKRLGEGIANADGFTVAPASKVGAKGIGEAFLANLATKAAKAKAANGGKFTPATFSVPTQSPVATPVGGAGDAAALEAKMEVFASSIVAHLERLDAALLALANLAKK